MSSEIIEVKVFYGNLSWETVHNFEISYCFTLRILCKLSYTFFGFNQTSFLSKISYGFPTHSSETKTIIQSTNYLNYPEYRVVFYSSSISSHQCNGLPFSVHPTMSRLKFYIYLLQIFNFSLYIIFFLILIFFTQA